MLFTITTLWANSADDILMIFSPENRIWHFIQIISLGDNLHVMSKPIFWEKQEKYFKMVSAENLPRVLSVKDMVLKVWTNETKCSYFCYVCLVIQLDENYWTWLDEIIAFNWAWKYIKINVACHEKRTLNPYRQQSPRSAITSVQSCQSLSQSTYRNVKLQ